MKSIFLTGLGLVLVLEGALYALFPNAMQNMMEQMRQMPPDTLRRGGLAIAFIGFALIYFLYRV